LYFQYVRSYNWAARMFGLTQGIAMSKSKQPQSRVGGRDSRNGQFIPLRETERRPDTTQRERIPLPGFGDTKKK